MALAIRLKETGTKNRKQWRIVVTDRRNSGKGRLVEEIGSYNSLVNPPEFKIQKERYQAWIQKGAQPSDVVKSLVDQHKA